jgi:ubiquinol-cytochrome c reductase cytochrome c1 subunit
MRRALLAAAAVFALLPPGLQAAEGEPPIDMKWPHEGFFGSYDKAALQRGYQVFEQVCASCHSAKYLAFRHLAGLGYGEEDIKAIAAQHTVTAGPDETGDFYDRPAGPTDYFPAPFPNEQAARAANNGALPPDLSLIVKARPGHEDYIYSLLVGYEEPPAGFEVPAGQYYNRYFPGHLIAMPPPLSEGLVEYADGTPATVPQMAEDVTQFLAWLSEPTMEERKAVGLKFMLFVLAMTGIFYGYKRRLWARLH